MSFGGEQLNPLSSTQNANHPRSNTATMTFHTDVSFHSSSDLPEQREAMQNTGVRSVNGMGLNAYRYHEFPSNF